MLMSPKCSEQKSEGQNSGVLIMTRFQLILPVQSQKPPNFIPVIEWKKCSKHLIFCIYMAYKVIEDIVFTQNTQILKITIFAI